MKTLILIMTLWRLKSPRFRNRKIANTGCIAFLPKDIPFKTKKTPDGGLFCCTEFIHEEITYGVICISLDKELSLNKARKILAAYMKKLHGPFFIFHSIGLTRDADWNSSVTCALVDYWQDAGGADWKIKGYTDGKSIGILYLKNIAKTDVVLQDKFLDSFHFPVHC